MKDKKNYKVKPLVFIIAGIAVLVLIAAAITAGVISEHNKSKENTVGMTLTQKNLRPQDAEADNNEVKEITTVEILMDDTAIPVGTTFMAAAIVEPADTDKALIWTSSNEDVMTVKQDGLVTVKGTGTAALTATVGDVSDAIAIEGIESAAAGSKNGYTVYTGNGSILKPSSSVPAGSSAGSGSGTGSSYNDNGSYSYNSTGNNSGYSAGTGSSHENSNSTGSDGKTSSDIGEVLNKEGFTQEYSNVYVYTDGGTYYGEIITQPDVSIIYIKQRNEGFDARIKGVLAQLLPESCNQVWNNYVSATTDRTFTVEDRKVRIVTASRGGHSQIVIYN
ncbi:MAG: Ig-like domain-containing protein [Lachnospira sp.]